MQLRHKAIATLILIVVVGLTFISTLVHLLTESWWFAAVDLSNVFWTKITWQIVIWVATLAIYGLFLWFNYWLASRYTRDRSFQFLLGTELEPYTKTISNLTAMLAIVIVAVGAANTSAGFWETSLKFINATEYNRADPIYSKDVGFYLFELPFYEALQTWLFTLLLSGLLIAIAVYLLKGIVGFNFSVPKLEGRALAEQKLMLERQWRNNFQGRQKTHITLLLAAIAITIAIDFWLKRYDLLYSADGVVWGAGYTDTHARLFSYWVMGIGALVLGVFLTLAVWLRRSMLPLYGIAVYLVVLFLVNGVYPELQQRFSVEPNELDKELPYIKNSLEFTRSAYDLETIDTNDYPVSSQLTAGVLQDR